MAAGVITVGVVEDHPLYRVALAGLLDAAPDFVVCTVAGSVAEFATTRRCPHCLVLLDMRLPGVQGAAAVRAVTGLGHRVLVLSAETGRSEVRGAMAAGAAGYLAKSADADEILRGLRQVAAGHRYASATLAPVLTDDRAGRGAGPELSDREIDVLSWLAAGERDEDIARTLKISVRTVRSYLDRIRDKTGLRRRSALTRYAIEHGVADFAASSRRLSA
ncbi:response regulator transcription factor [Plantactinospora sp. S1510]|uniref:Response regulator transcription factor n=1 Tax=Plantactinospora alkalitolerans TaxID=2789879 RepID=A0ABS0GXS0_9ACTN|nr:response regulator transcription factor [Plantactinospora alkalitolerans]MBF9130778.1 response regulator transcription factor [Plantactinospora alkalitolerans]